MTAPPPCKEGKPKVAEFSHDEVIRRTARRLGKKPEAVAYLLSVYANEYVEHARETDPALVWPMPGIQAAAVPVEEEAAKAARKPRTPRKSRAKASTPTENSETSEGVSEGEAEASVALDRDETHVVG